MGGFDRLYRSVLLAARFFSRGWGPTQAYESLARFNPTLVHREECAAALENHTHPISLIQVKKSSWGTSYTGSFLSPTATLLPNILPPEAETVRFELLQPSAQTREGRPVYIHLAGTGDHGFYRRRHMTALPLLKSDGIGALIIENPYYGSRKPKGQTLSQVLHVSDLFVMGLSLMLECLVLRKWLEGEGWGPVGVTGISMGGHNASLCGAVWPEPVPVVPCLSWSTASSAFTQGMLSGAVDWNVLEEQLVNSRTSSDKIREKVFDFAISQREVLREKQHQVGGVELRGGVESHSVVGYQTWMTSSGVGSQDITHQDRIARMHHQDSTHQQDRGVRTRRDISNMRDWFQSWLNTKRSHERSQLHWDTVSTLGAVLDLSTHLHNYPTPIAPELARFVAAKQDRYIPRDRIINVQQAWPGCEVTYVEGGHVSATICQQKAFRTALASKMEEKMAASRNQSSRDQSCC